MKKPIAVLLCLVLVLSLAACGNNEEALKARYDEGYKAGYDEGYKGGYDTGLKEGKDSAKPTEKAARFSGSFTATVEKLIPDYYALPGNTVAVVHFFQAAPFLLRFQEDMTGKLTEGKAYVFDFRTFEVPVASSEQVLDLKDYDHLIQVTSYRLAEVGETGLNSKGPVIEIVTK